ncbi:O-antigen polymerase [Roseivirga pacifica]|uniref:O-antigen polymerase n=1 Tax=Roseivirga pacifica TaxID=1267423 RepID=UPI0020962F4F|nr:O-antigen polymerase [Roseivirga pacifica]MCO6359489.1 hypothetical protein [Roseivirga pacifica]MCO6366859.1 hypothetical protein [Roseivirga pacifica]MCO6370609.1 hypothetical protein [Roseivirga pacifica]MCO6374515.1 hypothetical protein [Roseivirga pacifica]MCO6379774.1 hypothetical protein [Roseivirga pacifica]
MKTIFNVKVLEPFRLSLIGVLTWLALYVFIPLQVNIEITFIPFVYVSLCYLTFWLGIIIADGYWLKVSQVSNRTTYFNDKRKAQTFFWFCLALGLIAFTLKIYDAISLRGVSLEQNYLENRESTQDSGNAGAIPVLGAFLTVFQFVPFLLYKILPVKRSTIVGLMTVLLFFTDLFKLLFFASRSGVFLALMLLIIILVIIGSIKINWKSFLFFVIGGVFLMLVMSSIFLERSRVFAGDFALEGLLINAQYNQVLSGEDEAINKIFYTESDLEETINFSLITSSIYYVHGLFEFNYLYQNFNSEHAFGGYTYFIVPKFLSIITGISYNQSSMEILAPRQGVFTSFFGPTYIDFGWFGLFYMLILGLFIKYLYFKVKVGSVEFIPIFAYFTVVVLFFPVFNFISGAQGGYILVSSIIYLFLYRVFKKMSFYAE